MSQINFQTLTFPHGLNTSLRSLSQTMRELSTLIKKLTNVYGTIDEWPKTELDIIRNYFYIIKGALLILVFIPEIKDQIIETESFLDAIYDKLSLYW